ncbi:MAG: GFA family protein [Gammaproteobacteria bacterium]
MKQSKRFPLEGGCDCGHVRYRMETSPLFVHCCHCRWCQRESGSAFALNAMIESDRVTLLGAEPEKIETPSASGYGQTFARCPKCRIALWSNYAAAGPVINFVRVGTLDEPDLVPPDIHIFTESKQPWVLLSNDTPAFPGYYRRKDQWPADSLKRREVLSPRIKAYQAELRKQGE